MKGNIMIVTRFCPSNTGSLHLGSARTAIMALAHAKKNGGKCVLRIENTDKARSTHESLMDILDGLEWLGVKFDSGPSMAEVKHGKYDPRYFQSERGDIYNSYIDKLINEDKAYINADNVTVFKMPKEDVTFVDTILGEVTVPASELKDFPIRRADGSVLFHACVVIDDALSGITNVIRANDHASNTPKHIQLYKAFGFKVPTYSHMPLILDQSGAKLSKRRTDQCVLIKDFRAKGFLPSAVINMIGLMGWSPKDKIEVFDLDYLCKNFDIKDCLATNAKYDSAKMLSINAEHIKKLSVTDFGQELYKWAEQFAPEFVDKLNSIKDFEYFCKVFQPRCKVLSDIVAVSRFMFEDVVYDEKQIAKHIKADVVTRAAECMKGIDRWTDNNINDAINQAVTDLGIQIGKFAQPLRVMITGNGISPEIVPTLILLGKEKTMKRIWYCVDTYVGVKV